MDPNNAATQNIATEKDKYDDNDDGESIFPCRVVDGWMHVDGKCRKQHAVSHGGKIEAELAR